MNTAIELTYNINVAWRPCRSHNDPVLAVSLGVETPLEPNLNLFPTAIQNGHINLIIRCVIRLADERLSLDGIKSVCPLFVDSQAGIKLSRAMVMAYSVSGRRTVTWFASRRYLLPLFLKRCPSTSVAGPPSWTCCSSICGWCYWLIFA